MNSDDEKQIRENEELEMEESEPSEQPPICQSERESDSAPEMGPEGVAVSTCVCKSLDFLIGFAVGYTTDNLHAIAPTVAARYGRRKPFIAVGFPIWMLVMWLINNPPGQLSAGMSVRVRKGGFG